MTVKQWLMRGWTINREIDSLLRAKKDAYERFTSITSKLDGVSVSGSKDPHKYESYVQFQDEIDRRLDMLYEIKREILTAIGKIRQPTYRAVLTERYVNLHTLEQTAANLHYSYQHLCRLQGEAFNALRQVIGKDITIRNDM